MTNKIDEIKVTDEISALEYLRWGIEYWQKAFKLLPKMVNEDVVEGGNVAYEGLAHLIVSSAEEMVKFEKNIQEKRQSIYNELDETWNGFYKRYTSIKEKIEKLDNVFNKIDVYQADRVLDLLNKLDSIHPDTWIRYEKLSRKLQEVEK